MLRLRRRWSPDRTAAELDEELRFHIDMEAHDLMRRGVPPAEARRRAERDFGDYRRIKDDAREAGALPRLEGVLIDVRHALRQMRLQPGFTLVAVITLALGLGASTAIFSVVDSVLLRPLPYVEPEELVVIKEYPTERGVPEPGGWGAVSYPNFADWRSWPGRTEIFEEMALRGSTSFLIRDVEEPRDVHGGLVTGEYFDMLGVEAALGRTLAPDESEHTVVLSHGLWRDLFGGDPQVLGRSVRLDGESYVIVGVMPPWFSAGGAARLWIPLTEDNHPFLQQRGTRAYSVVARLADGVTVSRVQAGMETIYEALVDQYPEANESYSIQVVGLYDDIVGPVRATLLLLLAAVGLLVVLACANIANLLLARATRRRHETAMRIALGAGSARVAQQFLVESTLLALLGGGAGMLLGSWGRRAIIALTPTDIPRLDEPGTGVTVFLFALILSIATGVLFGLAPALQSTRGGWISALRKGSLGAQKSGRETKRLRSTLVVTEVALALVLLNAAALLVSSFAYLWNYEPGFEADNVLTLLVVPLDSRYPTPTLQNAFYEQLYDRLEQLPQVQAAGGGTRLPMESGNIQAAIDGQGSPRQEHAMLVNLRPVSGDYFGALRIPLLAGRVFRASDRGAVILNESAVRALWPGEQPAAVVGRNVRFSLREGFGEWLPVIGVVGDTRHGGLDPDPRPEVYQPHAVRSFGVNVVVVRTAGDPLEVAELAREAVHAVDPEQPIRDVRTMERITADSMRRPRFYASLFATFGVLALLMAAAGVFAMAMYSTSRRRREIGVRMAVGARGRDVVTMIVREGLALVTLGLLLGLAATIAVGRHLSDLLYGVSATDPVSIASALAVLAGAALFGFWLPAQRATRIDPTEALRLD